MNITIIAAMNNDRLIGIDGNLAFRLPQDMRRFRKFTINHAVIMGRKTFESINKIPLSDRLNVVLTHDVVHNINFDPNVIFVDSHINALKACINAGKQNIFVIGGEEVFREAMEYADRILLTVVDRVTLMEPGQTASRFPDIPGHFRLIEVDRQAELTFKTYVC